MLADVIKYCQVYSQRPKVKEYPDGDADFWHQAWDVAFIFSQDAMKGGVVTMTHVPKKVSIKGAFVFLRYSKISNKSTAQIKVPQSTRRVKKGFMTFRLP